MAGVTSPLCKKPTILKLQTMKGVDGNALNIIKRIAGAGPNYDLFGALLLSDPEQVEVNVIKMQYKSDGPETVIKEFAQKWLTKGGPTCTYEHFIYCVKEYGLGDLAELIHDKVVKEGGPTGGSCAGSSTTKESPSVPDGSSKTFSRKNVATDGANSENESSNPPANNESRVHGFELSDQTRAVPDAASFWNLNKYGEYTGEGTTLVMFDTGIAPNHPSFTGKGASKLDFYSQESNDIDGHGTLCAGVACGVEYQDQELAVTYRGVAPDATLAIWKGYDHASEENSDQWLEQLELLTHHIAPRPVDVVVISSGIDRHEERLHTVITKLINTNSVIVVCSASNDGAKTDLNIKYPAKYQETICVGAHNRHGERCDFSPRSDRVEFLALGIDVVGPILKKPGKPWNEPKRGTSYAAPAIGGLICLILEAVKKTCGDQIFQQIHNNRAMKELLKKLATKEGVIDHEKLEMFFKGLGPVHYIKELIAEKIITPI